MRQAAILAARRFLKFLIGQFHRPRRHGPRICEHGRIVPVVIRTHDARETSLRRAVRAIDRLTVVRGRSTVIRIEESLS